MAQLLKPCIVIALYALLLPVIGPLLDHHYVEWQHNHGHVYLGGGSAWSPDVHNHVYDSESSHAHLPGSDSPGNRVPQNGVAYLANYEGSGSIPIYSPSGPSTEPLCFPDPGHCPLLLSYIATEVAPAGALTAPPRKPPAA